MDDDFIQRELERDERGILTPSDREFLLGKSELGSDQSVYNKRSQIRTRIRNGLYDLNLIAETDMSHIDHVFKISNMSDGDRFHLERGLSGALALVYYVTTTIYADPNVGFEDLLKRAVWLATDEKDAWRKYSVQFNVVGAEPVDAARIADKIERHRLENMTEQEMRFYIAVQSRSGTPPDVGTEAAEIFLDNLETLREKEQFGAKETNEG